MHVQSGAMHADGESWRRITSGIFQDGMALQVGGEAKSIQS